MTRGEYIDFANALKNNYTIDFDKLPEFCDMAISALSESKRDLISRGEVESVLHNNLHALIDTDQLYQLYKDINHLPTYSFHDSAGVENYTVEKLNQILKWGYCFCDTDDNEFCKAIKNAIEIITALETLKAEIRDNANHCECVPDGSCIRVDKVLEIIDKHIGGE